jgi:hypothetical protein
MYEIETLIRQSFDIMPLQHAFAAEDDLTPVVDEDVA